MSFFFSSLLHSKIILDFISTCPFHKYSVVSTTCSRPVEIILLCKAKNCQNVFYRKCIKNKYIVVVKVQTNFDCYKTCTNTQKVLHLDKIICQLPMKMNALKSIQNGLLTYSFSTFLLHLRTLESPRLNVNLIPRLLAQFRKRKGKVKFSQMK